MNYYDYNRVKSRFSLKDLCLEAIADNIDQWFCSSISDSTLKNSMYILGPFECLSKYANNDDQM